MADSFVSRFGCYTIIWDTTERPLAWAIALTNLYAITEERHQGVIGGRTQTAVAVGFEDVAALIGIAPVTPCVPGCAAATRVESRRADRPPAVRPSFPFDQGRPGWSAGGFSDRAPTTNGRCTAGQVRLAHQSACLAEPRPAIGP